jgi:hypothetical protein
MQVLSLSQIISHSKNLRESNYLKFDRILWQDNNIYDAN